MIEESSVNITNTPLVSLNTTASASLRPRFVSQTIAAKLATLEHVGAGDGAPSFVGLGSGTVMPSPVQIKGSEPCDSKQRAAIAHQYRTFGFALVCNVEGSISADRLPAVAEQMGLGELYVPPYFKLMGSSTSVTSKGVAVISPISNTDKATHASFQTSRAEGLHVDGTVVAIGEVRTSFLFCNSPSAEGGESLLFNAVGACLDLFRRDPRLVAPLFHPEAMKRGKEEMGGTRIGPVFDLLNGELVTRFSNNDTTDWQYGFQRVKGLQKAYEALLEYTAAGSPFLLTFRLDGGSGLVMANDKLAHGRLSFTNSAERVRSMARTLHLTRPGQTV